MDSVFLLGDPEKLNLEDKNLERRNAVGSRLAVGEIVGKSNTPLGADRHHLQNLDPARDYLGNAEGCGAAAVYRAVEHLAVREGAVIVDGDAVGLLGLRAVSFLEDLVLNA